MLWMLLIGVVGTFLVFAGDLARSSTGSASGTGKASYAFIDVQADGVTPVTYSSCTPILIEINTRTMPDGAEGIVEDAVATMADLSGLDLVIEGETTRAPTDRLRYWAPVLIAWSDPIEHPELLGRIAGLAGSVSQPRGMDDRVEVYVTGQIVLDGPDFESMLAEGRFGRDQAVALVMHEVGHVLGLDHVDDPRQLMHHENYGVLAAQDGDRAGLALLGQGPCIPG